MSQQGGYSYEKELRKYTKNKVMTTEKLIKAIDINNEITRLKSYLVDLKSAKEIKGTAGLSCGGSHNVTIKYEYIEPIIDRLIQETEDNIRLFKRRFENL